MYPQVASQFVCRPSELARSLTACQAPNWHECANISHLWSRCIDGCLFSQAVIRVVIGPNHRDRE
eukprot:5527990-Amphidinium_carterae.1